MLSLGIVAFVGGFIVGAIVVAVLLYRFYTSI
jgi:hypothetical protein